MAFLSQTIWLGLEFQDFKEDGIKSDMTIGDVNFALALFWVIKNNTLLYLLYLKGIVQKLFETMYFDIHNLNSLFCINC